MEPASKVSVPAVVVILTKLSVPASVTAPAICAVYGVVVVFETKPEHAHVFPVKFVKNIFPLKAYVATPPPAGKPAVEVPVLTELVPNAVVYTAEYPDVVGTPPVPI